jgi:integrase
MHIVWFRQYWCAYERRDGKSRRTSLGTKDRDEAERRFIDLQTALKRPATTVAQMIEEYLAERAQRLTSPETVAYAMRRLMPVFGRLRPDQIDAPLCRAYAAQRRRQQVGNGLIRRELGVLRAVLRWHGKGSTPATFEMPAPPPPKDVYLTREQYRALREAARTTPHLYLFVVLAYTTAGRKSAILELTWDRVDFERGLIQLNRTVLSPIEMAKSEAPHNNKRRALVPMTDSAREALIEAKAAALTDHVIEYGGAPVADIKKAFGRAVQRAGLPAVVSPHALRHTAAVHMAESGVPMAEIAQFLGHTSEAITFKVYARFSPTYLRKAAGALE